METELLVVGGGLGGIAAALAALRRGRRVVLTEQYPWLGGQLTSQAVPPDEHPWIETLGATRSYRALRERVRGYYRRNYPLTDAARAHSALNPGGGWVSQLCHEPRVAVAVIEELLAPWRSAGRLRVRQPVRPVAADVEGDRVRAVMLADPRDHARVVVHPRYVIDATETGELLHLTGAEYVTGFESRCDTGEPSAPDHAAADNMQALTVCFALEHVDGDHTIERPARYHYWRAAQPPCWGAPLLSWSSPNPRTLEPTTRGFTPNPDDDPLQVTPDHRADPGGGNLWTFRRIAARRLFIPGHYPSDITLVNWPSIDYFDAPVIGVADQVARARLADACQLSLSMLYWMQTEAPRADGGTGFPGLRLRPDVMGSADGLAQAPYIREARRIRAVTTITERDVSRAVRGEAGAVRHHDSVGIGMYRIDLHPSTGGDGYLDIATEPFELPLGALLPQRVRNLLPGAKNIGTTHLTNGCYRLHPVEWNVGEAAGALAATCIRHHHEPHQIRADHALLERFQNQLVGDGVELRWPDGFTGY